MSAPSLKMLVLWFLAVAGWLAFSAFLAGFGVSGTVLFALHMLAVGVVLCLIAKATTVSEAPAFIMPESQGPSALTPYGHAAAWVSGFGTVGIALAILADGWVAFALLAGLVGGMVLSATILAPALAEAGVRSLPDWVSWRFGERSARVAKVLLTGAGLAILGVQMGFAGLLAQALFGVSPIIAISAVALLTLLAVTGGGMKAMIPAQAVLFLVLFVGVMVPALWLGVAQTGIVVPHLASGALLHEIAVAEARLGLAADPDPLAMMMLCLTALFGTLALPHTLVRWPIERSGEVARYFAQRSTVLVVLVVCVVPLFAIAARSEHLLAAIARGDALPVAATPAGAFMNGMAVLDPPAWLLAALGAGGFAAIVAACASATMLIASTLGGNPMMETAGGVLSRARWSGAGAAVFAALIATGSPIDPLTAFLALLAMAASALLAPFVLGLMWSRMTAGGALAGIVAGGAVCLTLAIAGWSATGGLALAGLVVSTGASVLVSLAQGQPGGSVPVRK